MKPVIIISTLIYWVLMAVIAFTSPPMFVGVCLIAAAFGFFTSGKDIKLQTNWDFISYTFLSVITAVIILPIRIIDYINE